jgi:hypothetical protein
MVRVEETDPSKPRVGIRVQAVLGHILTRESDSQSKGVKNVE